MCVVWYIDSEPMSISTLDKSAPPVSDNPSTRALDQPARWVLTYTKVS